MCFMVHNHKFSMIIVNHELLSLNLLITLMSIKWHPNRSTLSTKTYDMCNFRRVVNYRQKDNLHNL